jgi:hypothetical protein
MEFRDLMIGDSMIHGQHKEKQMLSDANVTILAFNWMI